METSNRPTRCAVIIGAGPAGLTAAYELLTRTNIVPIVLEQSDQVGGLSRTVNYKGNRLDVGGHRFFSKSQRVINWWLQMLPLQSAPGQTLRITYQRQSALLHPAK
ncbi:MAG TPA: NAD(P)-binding protein, partial [Bryobacteraceae bacterium]